MRVVHVLNELRPSGMERMLASSSAYWSEEGVEPIVLGVGRDHPFASDLQECGYEVHLVRSPRWRRRIDLVRTLRRLQPDVVHLHSEGAYLANVLTSKLALPRTRVVRTIHNVFLAHGAWLAKRRLRAMLADPGVSALVAPASDVASNEALIGRKTETVYNWVDARFSFARNIRAGSVPSGRDIAIVGNCSDIKNHLIVLRLIDQLDARLWHVGDESGGDLEEHDLLDHLERHGRVAGRGVSDPLKALLSAATYVMPSKHEGMGVALAEAIEVGLPAVVADVPGLQWARGIPGVTHVEKQASWATAIGESLAGPRHFDREESVDFSAARGAREYATIYRRVTRG